MNKINFFTTNFFVRDKKDMLSFYQRVDFWVSLLSLVLIVLSLVLARYTSNGGGTTFTQMWKGTEGNWALVTCGLLSIIGVCYVFVTNFILRNSIMASSINICLGILMAVSFVVEYLVLTKVGAYIDGDNVYTMGNSVGAGFYCGIVGSLIIVGLEFYKLGGQGYFTAEDFMKDKTNNGVEVVDGVVVIDGEKVEVSNEIDKENKTNIRIEADGEVQENADEKIVNNNEQVENTEAEPKTTSKKTTKNASAQTKSTTNKKASSTKSSTGTKTTKSTTTKSTTKKTEK